jgi:hypothetical protein
VQRRPEGGVQPAVVVRWHHIIQRAVEDPDRRACRRWAMAAYGSVSWATCSTNRVGRTARGASTAPHTGTIAAKRRGSSSAMFQLP